MNINSDSDSDSDSDSGSGADSDCDSDSDCSFGLKCFQRSGYTPVPGCSGTGVFDWDYCYKPEIGTVHVFTRSSSPSSEDESIITTWVEETKLVASDASLQSEFGASVALYGNRDRIGSQKRILILIQQNGIN